MKVNVASKLSTFERGKGTTKTEQVRTRREGGPKFEHFVII